VAIAQPTYNTTTSALVTHVGAYTDTREAAEVTNRNAAIATHEADTTSVHGIADTSLLPRYNLFNGTTFPARPAGTVVFWIGGAGANDPTASMSNGDVWIPSSA
jgi:hypothetical protein